MKVVSKTPFGFFPLSCCIHKKERAKPRGVLVRGVWLKGLQLKGLQSQQERGGLVQVES